MSGHTRRKPDGAVAGRLRLLAALAAFGVLAAGPGSGPIRPNAALAQASGAISQYGQAGALLSSPAEVTRLQGALAAADAGAWSSVQSAMVSTGDPLVRRLLQWRLAAAPDAPQSFDDLDGALRDLADWPQREAIRRRAEGAIQGSSLSSADRIAWFTANPPTSGDGQAALAYALLQSGRTAEAVTLARRTWSERALSERMAYVLSTGFGDRLTASDHAARVDLLLWLNEPGEARGLLPQLAAADRAVAQARLALRNPPRRGLQPIVDAGAAAGPTHPGLLYERARFVRRAGRPEEAMALALRIDPAQAPAVARDKIHDERRTHIPRLLRAGDGGTAYRLVQNHGLTAGEAFADAEWLAGWISLRYLRQPAQAEAHFARLNSGVSAPVSKARAYYWQAEALAALGRGPEAEALRRDGARLNFTFYGQLAAQKLDGAANLDFQQGAAIPDDVRAGFERRELVQALRLMAALGDREDFEAIAFHLDDVLPSAEEHELLAEIARNHNYIRTGVRSAKAGMRRGILAPDAAYPIVPLPSGATQLGRPEPALIYAITRQETEFDQRAVSSAGARGLMQLMPATARITARIEGLPYEPGALLDDANYNLTLGAAHLEHLLREWNGSYVLTIASYNAGSGRAREWIGAAGDPRTGAIDVIDWIELIPFAETRNYVHRVMENVGVYRRRLADGPVPIRLSQDLRR